MLEAPPNYLDTQIQCISDKLQHSTHVQSSTLPSLYNHASQLINQFSTNISRCKRYNQAKINRKYQIIINDLQAEIKRLSQKLKLEQDARSPTKKHVSDILDKLVIYRDDNKRLQQENESMRGRIKELQNILDERTLALQKMQTIQGKGAVERLPAINDGPNISQTIKQYLKDKEQVRKITKMNVSNLQKYLNHIRPKLWNFTLTNLLQELDKWSQGIKDKPEIDMWRIRSSIARKFSDYIDDSSRLVKPSLGREDRMSFKSSNKYSQLGSKRDLDISISG